MHKRIALLVAAGLLGLLPLLLITSFTVVAQGRLPGTPTPSKFVTPSPTPKGGLSPTKPAIIPVDFNGSSNSARGTHAGERSTYTVIVANSGASTTGGTLARATIPW